MDPQEQTSAKFESKYKFFIHENAWSAKWRTFGPGGMSQLLLTFPAWLSGIYELSTLEESSHKSMVSCEKGPTRHAYAWQIGSFWQDTLEMQQGFQSVKPDLQQTY